MKTKGALISPNNKKNEKTFNLNSYLEQISSRLFVLCFKYDLGSGPTEKYIYVLFVRSNTLLWGSIKHIGGLCRPRHQFIVYCGFCVLLPLSLPLPEAWENAFETNQEITYQSEAPKSNERALLPKGRGFQGKAPQLFKDSSCCKVLQAT